jgi:hypothetical protein
MAKYSETTVLDRDYAKKDEYTSTAALPAVLNPYAKTVDTTSALAAALVPYAKKVDYTSTSALAAALVPYAKKVDYTSTSALAAALVPYAKTADLHLPDMAEYVLTSILDRDYAKKFDISSLVTEEAMTTAINHYKTTVDLAMSNRKDEVNAQMILKLVRRDADQI